MLSQSVVFGVIALVFFVFSRRGARAFPGEAFWALGFAAFFLSQLAVFWRGPLPIGLSIMAGNLFMVLGVSSVVVGTDLFHDRKPPVLFHALVILVSGLVFVVFGLLRPDALPRVLGLNLACAAMLGYGGLGIRALGRKEANKVAGTTGGLELFLAGLYLLRLSLVGLVDRSEWLNSGWSEAALLLAIGAGYLTLAFIFRRLISLRLRADLDAALGDRDLLLREMHHRTKNELALVQSLLSLEQAEGPSPPGLEERLAIVGSRVNSIGLVHDLLHKLGAVKEVRLDEYIALIGSSLATGDPLRRIELKLEPVTMDSRRAVWVGLVVNELAINALRHAFPGGRAGCVTISLRGRGGEAAVVEVRDDGIGLDPGAKREGFGSLLVDLLASQLGSKLVVEVSGGTRIELAFSLG